MNKTKSARRCGVRVHKVISESEFLYAFLKTYERILYNANFIQNFSIFMSFVHPESLSYMEINGTNIGLFSVSGISFLSINL